MFKDKLFRRKCPVRDLNVHEGVVDDTHPDTPPALLVGVVNTDQSVKKQKRLLDIIREKVIKTCNSCGQHHARDGDCQPTTYFRGGMVSTVYLTEESDVPDKVKSDPKGYFYKKH